MIIDPEDIDTCEKHLCNFVIGDECHQCREEAGRVSQMLEHQADGVDRFAGLLERSARDKSDAPIVEAEIEKYARWARGYARTLRDRAAQPKGASNA